MACAASNRSNGSRWCIANCSTAVACASVIGSSSKLFRAISRGKNVWLGSPKSSLPVLTLIAISQQLAMLSSLRLLASSNRPFAAELRRPSSQTNHSIVCESSSRLGITCTRGSLLAAHQNPEPSNASCPSRCPLCKAIGPADAASTWLPARHSER